MPRTPPTAVPGVMAESMGLDRAFAVEPHFDAPEPDVPEAGCGGERSLGRDQIPDIPNVPLARRSPR
jgi:hypothetical protein